MFLDFGSKIILLGMLALVPACSTHQPNVRVIPPQTGVISEYAPENEVKRPGLVRFTLSTDPKKVVKRQEAAYKSMHDACGGPYQITNQYIRKTGYPMEGTSQFYEFECVEKSGTSEQR